MSNEQPTPTRQVLHLTVGTDNWEPSSEDMQTITEMVKSAPLVAEGDKESSVRPKD